MTPNPHKLQAGPELGAVTGSAPKREMTMMAWLATEGGRKCPQCGKYAKADELGYIGGCTNIGGAVTHISIYGHRPGYGCNRAQNDKLTDCPPNT